MRNLLFICLLTVCSCAPWCTQIVHTAPLDAKAVKEYKGSLIHENDSIKICYYFWAERGVMAFSVQNKLDIPVYVDWGRSSFINANGWNLSYYQPESKTIEVNQTSASLYAFTGNAFGALNYMGQNVSIREVKNERITFIAPHSAVFKASYHIMPQGKDHFKLEGGRVIKDSYADGRFDSVNTYVVRVARDKARVIFHNYITYATTEQMQSPIITDDAFYVRKVITMPEYAANLSGANENMYTYDAPNTFYLLGLTAKIKGK